jgi:hypothetical protein
MTLYEIEVLSNGLWEGVRVGNGSFESAVEAEMAALQWLPNMTTRVVPVKAV